MIKAFFKTYTPANILREVYYNYLLPKKHSDKVGAFYDQHHEAFLEVYGELIQAFRTHDIADILTYELKQIGITQEMTVLDAGCGVGKPARFFASKSGATIHGISVSKKQIAAAKQLSKDAENLHFEVLDYHEVDKYFPSASFDRVYFLESFGHSTSKKQLLDAVWNVLKPGGEVYIKDLFRRIAPESKDQRKIDREIERINSHYHYDVADLNKLMDIARKQGFVIKFIQTLDIPLDQFEDLTISNKFQELTGICPIHDFSKYVFPVDFFEVMLYKPAFNMEEAKDRYFLQNLLHQKNS
ncbi:class I SAM-dependent methyltransferase [Marinoscillum furvescens]|uniref:Methyltransferase family protein n=1 Tax=Marinoscillum furvescens DSM 4134 TaxID=1122208 RepID=A0A3D9KXG7_MARFU|nr:class I SAM-dependent methyltransferase [Marinoscillum furvescens]RED92307.1 methyltransferase family protein [Marinoscillum furvescens DSM 4134]